MDDGERSDSCGGWRIEHNWQGKWMIGKEVPPVDGKDKDFLGLEE